MLTFYSFPKEHWLHLRTNRIESPFAALRLRTDAAKRFKKVPNATGAIWKLLMVAEKTFRRLNAPELLRELHLGAVFVDGVRRGKTEEKGRRPPNFVSTPLDKTSPEESGVVSSSDRRHNTGEETCGRLEEWNEKGGRGWRRTKRR